MRTLVLLSMVLGSSFSVMQIAMPRVVEEDFGLEAGSAATVMAMFGAGMFLSSVVMVSRPVGRHGWNIAVLIGVGLGGGQFALSLATGFTMAMVIMFLWGVNAGVAMTSHRTVLQASTAPEMMGRVGSMMTGTGGLRSGRWPPACCVVVSPADDDDRRWRNRGGASALSWRPAIVRLT